MINKTQKEQQIEALEKELTWWRRQISLWGGDYSFEEYKRAKIERLENRLKALQKSDTTTPRRKQKK